MDASAILQRLQSQFGDRVTGGNPTALDPWIELAPQALSEIARVLRDDPALRFDMLHSITAVDYLEPDPKKAAKFDYPPHLELLYHLSSFPWRHRIVLKLMLPRWEGDCPGALPRVPSVAGIWSTANWHEREAYDLSGVFFVGHPDLRRILCPEDWVGHPLRKDYSMPEEYHGIRVR